MASLELSIDGVGEWAAISGPRWTIGGPDGGADLEFLAPLPKRAAAVEWTGEDYRLVTADGSVPLKHGGRADLPGGVSMTFRRPHPWTPAATLTWDGLRPRDNTDGLVLWAGPCVLGPDPDSHVVCGDWEESVVLFEWPDGPRWKRVAGGQKDGRGQGGQREPVNPLSLPALIETDGGRVQLRARNEGGA